MRKIGCRQHCCLVLTWYFPLRQVSAISPFWVALQLVNCLCCRGAASLQHPLCTKQGGTQHPPTVLVAPGAHARLRPQQLVQVF